jgi:hypothetical protein
MRVYIAGPMSGYPDHNFPAFHDAAVKLREWGLDVANPAEADWNDDLTRSWDFYMRRDIPLLCTCDMIAMLAGWRESKGATLEYQIAKALGMAVLHLTEG